MDINELRYRVENDGKSGIDLEEIHELLKAAEKERDTLCAKIEQMQRQEPVAWCATDESGTVVEALGMNQSRRFDTPLYLTPVAQPAQSVPDGFVWPECPKRRQSHVLFDDGYEEGWAACISTAKAMLTAVPSVPDAVLVAVADLVAQMEIVSRVGFIDIPNDKDSCAAFCMAEGTWLELVSCVESLAAAINSAPKPEE